MPVPFSCSRIRVVLYSDHRVVLSGRSPVRAPKAPTSVAAKLVGRDDLGVLAPAMLADVIAIPGDPIADIGATATVDLVT